MPTPARVRTRVKTLPKMAPKSWPPGPETSTPAWSRVSRMLVVRAKRLVTIGGDRNSKELIDDGGDGQC